MKTSISIFLLSSLMFSCSETIIGPVGPRGDDGPIGPQGAQGENGYVFEYENIDFTSSNNYEVFLTYPSDFEGLESDVAIVYLLWDVQEVDGQSVDIWRPLAQQILFTDGILQYNFDFSKNDVRLFLAANFSLDELIAIDTDGWVARVVVVPGTFWGSGRVAVNDYDEVKSILGLPELATERKGNYSRRN
ncbi:MAG: hypothetical protein ACJA08_000237 [Cyclobacteriaceae bacterium]|jgi:hypothetical protein